MQIYYEKKFLNHTVHQKACFISGIPEESIGQMVAKKAAKKRRSKENNHHPHNDTKEEVEKMFKDGESHNKENVSETVRMNRSANRKRLLNLMQRAEASANEKKKAAMVTKSIKVIMKVPILGSGFYKGPF